MVTVGVLALQGGFAEHLKSLRKAASYVSGASSSPSASASFDFIEVRNPKELAACDGLVIPGGESTTLSLVAAQSGLLQPLREFVKVSKKPTWGTCAGLILLCEEASATKRGGQELVGGLDVKVHRNHFGRQIESFVTDLDLPFLSETSLQPRINNKGATPFPAVFIRAPVVDRMLTENVESIDAKIDVAGLPEPSLAAPSANESKGKVDILAILPGRHASNRKAAIGQAAGDDQPPIPPRGAGDIVALRQDNVFGTSFHPELTEDVRIHVWWLEQVAQACP